MKIAKEHYELIRDMHLVLAEIALLKSSAMSLVGTGELVKTRLPPQLILDAAGIGERIAEFVRTLQPAEPELSIGDIAEQLVVAHASGDALAGHAGRAITLQSQQIADLEQRLRVQQGEADHLCNILFRGKGTSMYEDNDRENWLARLPQHIRERENELPEDLRKAYWDGYKLAEEGGWLSVDLVKKRHTKEFLQQVIANQIGFIDGLKEFRPHLTLVKGRLGSPPS